MVQIKIIGDKQVNTRLSNLRKYAIQVVGAPVQNLVSQQAIAASIDQARRFFASPSRRPSYPLRWKSPRQKMAVMAKLKAEGNLPYRRTGQLAKAWEANVKANSIEISNTAQSGGKFIAPFVIGAFQQPFHTDTGWTKSSSSIEKQIIKPIAEDVLKRAKEGIAGSKHA